MLIPYIVLCVILSVASQLNAKETRNFAEYHQLLRLVCDEFEASKKIFDEPLSFNLFQTNQNKPKEKRQQFYGLMGRSIMTRALPNTKYFSGLMGKRSAPLQETKYEWTSRRSPKMFGLMGKREPTGLVDSYLGTTYVARKIQRFVQNYCKHMK